MTGAERRLLRLAAVWAVVAIAWLCGACAHWPETLRVRGTLVRVEHRPDYEAHCPMAARLKDANICDMPPVCCAYRATVADATGHTTKFYAFWPRYAVGLLGLVPLGTDATFTLHIRRLVTFPCSLYGCQVAWEYAVDSDADIVPTAAAP